MKNNFVLDLLAVLGISMMMAVAVINSYVAFFGQSDYTGGMLAASAFWGLIGWAFLYLSMSTECRK